MSRKPLLVVVLAALLGLSLAAGCGGGDDGSASDEAAPAATTSESSKPAVSGGSLANCKEFQQAAANVGQAFAAATTGANADLEQSANAFDALASKAPEEVRADFQTINDAFQKLAEALKDVDLSATQAPDPETLAKLQKAMSEIDQAKVDAASTRISAWAQKNCKA